MYPINNYQIKSQKSPFFLIIIIACLLLLCCADIALACGGMGSDRRFNLLSLPLIIYFSPFFLFFLPFIAVITTETLILCKKEGLYSVRGIFLSSLSYIFPLIILIIATIVSSLINQLLEPLMVALYEILLNFKLNVSHFFLDNLPIILIISLIFALNLYLMTKKNYYLLWSLGFAIWGMVNLLLVELFANQYQQGLLLFFLIVSLLVYSFIFNWIQKTCALYFLLGKKHKNIAQTSFSMAVASYPILALSFGLIYGRIF